MAPAGGAQAFTILAREYQMTTSILIADDHGLVRAGLRSLLEREADFQVVGEADNGYAALGLVSKLHPDLLLVDIGMPGPGGPELVASLRSREPATHVLIVSMHEDLGLVRQVMAAGASGYLTKRVAEAELIRAIRVIMCGGTYLTPSLRLA